MTRWGLLDDLVILEWLYIVFLLVKWSPEFDAFGL
jgi:hypothetical protein